MYGVFSKAERKLLKVPSCEKFTFFENLNFQAGGLLHSNEVEALFEAQLIPVG